MDARTPPNDRPKTSTGATLRRAIAERPYLSAAIALAGVIVLAAGFGWWLHARHFESTDDAFIDARVTQVSSQVNGAIVEVPVTDNQQVDAGAVLVRIDDRDFRTGLEQAKAQVAQAVANVANLTAQLDAQQARIDQARQEVGQAEGALTFAREENQRYQTLLKSGTGTQQRAQQSARAICSSARRRTPARTPTRSPPTSRWPCSRPSSMAPTRR